MVKKADYQRYRERVQALLSGENELGDAQVEQAIFEVLSASGAADGLSVRDKLQLRRRLFDSLRGLDVLQPLLDDDDVTDIMVNGPTEIFYEKAGQILCPEDGFDSPERLAEVIRQIVGAVDRAVNEAHPIVDARLPDGSRVNAVFPPASPNGPVLTIRRFRKNAITPEELVEWGTLTSEAMEFLKQAVVGKQNLFVCGGTASGKTTLLNVLTGFIPPEERIITIEDTAELRPENSPNRVALETRNKGTEVDAVTIRDLMRCALRMRPDRIIVGEIRGPEALDMLQAMNSGHEGSLSTGHANSCRDMLARIETMVLMGSTLPLSAIRGQIASALDMMVFVRRGEGGKRFVEEIARVRGLEDGRVVLETVFERRGGVLLRADDVNQNAGGSLSHLFDETEKDTVIRGQINLDGEAVEA